MTLREVEGDFSGVLKHTGDLVIKGKLLSGSNIEVTDGSLIIENDVGDNCVIAQHRNKITPIKSAIIQDVLSTGGILIIGTEQKITPSETFNNKLEGIEIQGNIGNNNQIMSNDYFLAKNIIGNPKNQTSNVIEAKFIEVDNITGYTIIAETTAHIKENVENLKITSGLGGVMIEGDVANSILKSNTKNIEIGGKTIFSEIEAYGGVQIKTLVSSKVTATKIKATDVNNSNLTADGKITISSADDKTNITLLKGAKLEVTNQNLATVNGVKPGAQK